MGTSLADLYSANHSGIKGVLAQYRSHSFGTMLSLEAAEKFFTEVGALQYRRWKYDSILYSFSILSPPLLSSFGVQALGRRKPER